MADTYKECQPFLPLNSTVLFGCFRCSKMSSQKVVDRRFLLTKYVK